jgi:hypothetical protein
MRQNLQGLWQIPDKLHVRNLTQLTDVLNAGERLSRGHHPTDCAGHGSLWWFSRVDIKAKPSTTAIIVE